MEGLLRFLMFSHGDHGLKGLFANTPDLLGSRRCVTMLAWNYAARVLRFSDRATLAFLAGFVAADPVLMGAAAAALLPALSTEVVRISR
jgi:hypothetical protein